MSIDRDFYFTRLYPLQDHVLAIVMAQDTPKDWEQVRWIDPPDPVRYLAELNQLGEQLILV